MFLGKSYLRRECLSKVDLRVRSLTELDFLFVIAYYIKYKNQEVVHLLKKNEIYRTEIIDYTTEGSGVCKIDGITVFVPSAAVGDIADVKILKTAKSYAFGKIESLTKPSVNRLSKDCEVSDKCGGCSFRHITYSSELQFKQKRVYDALTRIGGVNGELIGTIIGSEKCNYYRNKAQFPITNDKNGRLRVGFFAPRSHRVISTDGCLLQSEIFVKAEKIFLEWAEKYKLLPYDEITHTGLLRHLYLRYAEKTSQLMVCIVANADNLKHGNELVEMLKNNIPELTTVVLNINTEKTNVITGKKCKTLYGDGYITDELCGLRFRISPLSFYQVNRTQAERLYYLAEEFAALKSNETLIDMYCGTGTIGLTMAHKVKKLIGVEIVPQAIDDAKKNASYNNITNAEFICADASAAAAEIAGRGIAPDCIILDPPRKGCDSSLIKTVSDMKPKRVVYVSCDPATLARDIKLFSELGYSLQKAIPVDMFPRTPHVETVVLLSKEK